ncbi:hypothetical protein L1987_35208 [Smallanthus sonchifolius]|uniref:Uncharacterized protein n=1 Tax=Smallanthus sonchifolius TaxID=185202 RepID=A0ACB9HWS7_9ASTR|nr:hypothetical protein L1987_35208 [Smallanthus sonchifolius]
MKSLSDEERLLSLDYKRYMAHQYLHQKSTNSPFSELWKLSEISVSLSFTRSLEIAIPFYKYPSPIMLLSSHRTQSEN